MKSRFEIFTLTVFLRSMAVLSTTAAVQSAAHKIGIIWFFVYVVIAAIFFSLKVE